jgi:hypothetical protein
MTPAKTSSPVDEISSETKLDAMQLDNIKRGRELTKARNEREASHYSPRRITWEKGRKLEAMQDWSTKLMCYGFSRKAVKAAWALSYSFNSVDGACFEKKATLADRAGLSKQTLKDALTELEKMRFITRQKEKRGKTILTVIYPTIPDMEDCTDMSF